MEINYKEWAVDMCSLLDEIESHRDDPEAVGDLCRLRFDLARKNGVVVTKAGPAVSGSA